MIVLSLMWPTVHPDYAAHSECTIVPLWIAILLLLFKKKNRKEGREGRREGGRKEEDNGPHTGEVYYKYRVKVF